jgi:hypothetical protein
VYLSDSPFCRRYSSDSHHRKPASPGQQESQTQNPSGCPLRMYPGPSGPARKFTSPVTQSFAHNSKHRPGQPPAPTTRALVALTVREWYGVIGKWLRRIAGIEEQKLTTLHSPPHRYGVKRPLPAKIKCVAAEARTPEFSASDENAQRPRDRSRLRPGDLASWSSLLYVISRATLASAV